MKLIVFLLWAVVSEEFSQKRWKYLAHKNKIWVNSRIETYVCSKQFNTAEIVPIFKSGDKIIIGNYRPTSLVSYLTKIFDKVIFTRLYNLVTESKSLTSN